MYLKAAKQESFRRIMVRRTKKNQNQKKCCKTGIVSQNHGSQNQKKSFRRIILRNVAYSPLDSESRGASRGDFSTTPVSSKDGPLWTLDNFLVTCPLPPSKDQRPKAARYEACPSVSRPAHSSPYWSHLLVSGAPGHEVA